MNDLYLERPIEGLIHIGANTGQEYYAFNDVPSLLFFEPLTYFECKQNCPTAIVEPYAIGDDNKFVDMYLASNNDASASVLKPVEHETYYPHITFNGTQKVQQITLDSYFENHPMKYDAILIDVQGYDLQALKGAVKTLQSIKQIQTEVSFKELYEGTTGMDELNDFLIEQGFELKLLVPDKQYPQGEALYVKSINTNS